MVILLHVDNLDLRTKILGYSATTENQKQRSTKSDTRDYTGINLNHGLPQRSPTATATARTVSEVPPPTKTSKSTGPLHLQGQQTVPTFYQLFPQLFTVTSNIQAFIYIQAHTQSSNQTISTKIQRQSFLDG